MKVDYDKLSETYDRFRGGGGPYLDTLTGLARSSDARRVLEIGAGTGNNTAAFCRAYPCILVGLELAWGMLGKARAKSIPAHWVQGSAYDVPLQNAAVDFIFGCYVLHHLDDVGRVFRECARVLRRGCAAFVTASLEFIARHPMNRYFPSFAAIDGARFKSEGFLRAALAQAGFADIGTKVVKDNPRPINLYYVERVANKFISTYAIMPQDEFETGLRRLRADVEKTGRLDVDMVWEALIIWGSRGGVALPRDRMSRR